MDDFNIEYTDLFTQRTPTSNFGSKFYKFLLIIPKKVISDKIDEVHDDVGSDIKNVFIIPFALFSLIMMIVISYFLRKISTHITEPIIELF
jgi:hypothetical protein